MMNFALMKLAVLSPLFDLILDDLYFMRRVIEEEEKQKMFRIDPSKLPEIMEFIVQGICSARSQTINKQEKT